MELHELESLGEVSCEKTLSVDGIFCRHGINIREELSTAHGSEKIAECPQCVVEMEILTRLDRIEKKLDGSFRAGGLLITIDKKLDSLGAHTRPPSMRPR